MNIHFIGHSTFLLESGEHRLLIDPFIEGNPQATVTLAEAREWKLSAVLISHAHGDHWGNALDFARTGVPAHAAIPAWPAYDTADRATLVLDSPCRIDHDPRGETRALWQAITDTA